MSIQQTQDYYRERLVSLDFIEDSNAAEKITKAALGILTSDLSDQEAKEFTARLPDYLSYEVLRNHQIRPADRTPNEAVIVIADQFDLERDQAEKAIREVLSVTKEQASGEISQIAYELPAEWAKWIDKS